MIRMLSPVRASQHLGEQSSLEETESQVGVCGGCTISSNLFASFFTPLSSAAEADSAAWTSPRSCASEGADIPLRNFASISSHTGAHLPTPGYFTRYRSALSDLGQRLRALVGRKNLREQIAELHFAQVRVLMLVALFHHRRRLPACAFRGPL
jgi:hypothetical protein